MKYIVISQDRDIFRVFKDALGIEPMKISSILAATTVLSDKDGNFDFVVVDKELKGIESLIKLLKKRHITLYLIGDTFEKPITVQQIKDVILEEEDPQEQEITPSILPNNYTSGLDRIPKEIDNKSNSNHEEEKIQIRVRGESNESAQYRNRKEIKLKPSKRKLEAVNINNSTKESGFDEVEEPNTVFKITSVIGKGIKSVLPSKENLEGIIPKFKGSKTKIISQQVIGIRRVKGGVGATSVALHLAQAFNTQAIKTCIIDVNFADGGSDLSYYLNLPKLPHWGSFLRNPENKSSFQESLVDYKGISILQVPPAMSLIEDYLTPEAVIKAMNYARKHFAMVIIDLPNAINPIIREVLDSFITTTVLITSGHISELNRLEKLNDLDNPILVLNGQGSKNINRFKEYLDGITHSVTIPEDTELYRYLEKNNLRSLNTPYGTGINNLAHKILDM